MRPDIHSDHDKRSARCRVTPVARRALAGLALTLLLASCATFVPEPVDPSDSAAGIYRDTIDGVTVATTLLADEDARRLYGVPLADVGLQAIWVQVDNRSDRALWLLVSALDERYFAPDEAAVLFHAGFSSEDEERITHRFRELAVPLKTTAGGISEGYVLAPRHEGGRYVSVQLAGGDGVRDFGFAVTLPDGDFDFERLHPDLIYAGATHPDLDLDQARAVLRDLPCCTHRKDGSGAGDPLNLVLVGDIDTVLASLSRSSWSFTHRIGPESIKRLIGATLSGAAYSVAPVSNLYLFGRPQDIALQHARNTIVQRNHLRLWLAPFRIEGRAVWVGQVSRDIDIKLTSKSTSLTTHVIDPNIDEAREHLLQTLMVKGAIDRFGFIRGQAPTTEEAPYTNLTDDPYFTDGLRLLARLTGATTTPLHHIEFLEWNNSADPVREFQEPTERSESGGSE